MRAKSTCCNAPILSTYYTSPSSSLQSILPAYPSFFHDTLPQLYLTVPTIFLASYYIAQSEHFGAAASVFGFVHYILLLCGTVILKWQQSIMIINGAFTYFSLFFKLSLSSSLKHSYFIAAQVAFIPKQWTHDN